MEQALANAAAITAPEPAANCSIRCWRCSGRGDARRRLRPAPLADRSPARAQPRRPQRRRQRRAAGHRAGLAATAPLRRPRKRAAARTPGRRRRGRPARSRRSNAAAGTMRPGQPTAARSSRGSTPAIRSAWISRASICARSSHVRRHQRAQHGHRPRCPRDGEIKLTDVPWDQALEVILRGNRSTIPSTEPSSESRESRRSKTRTGLDIRGQAPPSGRRREVSRAKPSR